MQALNLPTPYFSCSVGIHMFMLGAFTWAEEVAAKRRRLMLGNAFYWRALLRYVLRVIV